MSLMQHRVCLALAAAAVASACAGKHRASTQSGSGYATTMSMAGATQILTSGTLDLTADTITLPLHQGSLSDGRTVWYILTDVSDPQKATDLGLVYAPLLFNAATAKSTRTATVDANGQFVFSAGTVAFSPKRTVVPGAAPNYFPPLSATPGSVADAAYSPFVTVAGTVYNAPVLAFDVAADKLAFCGGNADYDLVHDKVLKICPATSTVTLALTHGYAAGHEVVYLSFDANVGLAATLEAATLAAAEDDLKGANASQELFAFVNGETGAQNPERQGFDSALAGDGSPLNILGGFPTLDAGYSPLWDVHMAVWTDQAIAAGQRHRVTSTSDVAQAVSAGQVTGPGGAAFGSSGILVNCPVVAVLP